MIYLIWYFCVLSNLLRVIWKNLVGDSCEIMYFRIIPCCVIKRNIHKYFAWLIKKHSRIELYGGLIRFQIHHPIILITCAMYLKPQLKINTGLVMIICTPNIINIITARVEYWCCNTSENGVLLYYYKTIINIASVLRILLQNQPVCVAYHQIFSLPPCWIVSFVFIIYLKLELLTHFF